MTHVGEGAKGLNQILIDNGLKQSATSDDVVTAGGAIYIKDHNPETIKKIVSVLRPQQFVGAIFTKGAKAGDMKGFVEGTLSFETIHWNHSRAADILVDANWDDRVNSAGYAGASFMGGVAGHGTIGYWDVHIPLIVSGPAFKNAFESELPTSNVDLAPTVLHILNIAIPATMDGRVMSEMLRKPVPGAATKAKKETIEAQASYPGGTYKVTMERTILGKYQYVDGAKTERK
jgi:arylsulfatase A-like enzyme